MKPYYSQDGQGMKYDAIGKRFGISDVATRLICIRKTWKHVLFGASK